MGQGRGSRVPASSPATAPLTSFAPATAPLASFAPAQAPSSLSAPAPAVTSQYPTDSVVSSSSAPPPSSASVSTEALMSDVEKKLTMHPSAPSSSKAIRFPDRPGFGRLGRKIQVRANHFQVQVADRDLHHYDVSFAPEIASKKVSREVISQLVRMHRETILGKSLPAYDGRKSLFTAGSLPFTSKDFVIKLDEKNEGGSAASGSVGL